MGKRLVLLAALFVALGTMAWAAGDSWTGTISDSHCGAKHSQASAAAATCVASCVKGGAKYVLVSGGKVYELDAQDKFADYAGKSVKVTGTMNGTAITVTSVEPAS